MFASTSEINIHSIKKIGLIEVKTVSTPENVSVKHKKDDGISKLVVCQSQKKYCN